MLTLDPATQAALDAPGTILAQLVEMDLDIPQYANTTGGNIVYGGNTYIGVGALGRIDVIDESPTEIKSLRFELPCVMSTEIAQALVGMPAGREVRIHTAVIAAAASGLTVVYRKLEWSGLLDVPQIVEGEQTSVVQVTAEHIGIDLLRPSGYLYSDQDQQRLHPGDRSWQYVIDQADKTVIWPAASFFRK